MNSTKLSTVGTKISNIFTATDLDIKPRRLSGIIFTTVLFVVIIVLFMLSQSLPSILSDTKPTPEELKAGIIPADIIVNGGYLSFGLFIIFMLFYWLFGSKYNPIEDQQKHPLSWWFKWIIVGWIALILVGQVVSFLFTLESTGNEDTLRQSMANVNPFIALFIIGIIPPMIEEFMFRRYLMGILFNGHWVGIIFSGIAFGAMHMSPNDPNLVPVLLLYSALGWVLAIAYRLGRSYWLAVFIHMVNNSIVTIGYIFGTELIEEEATAKLSIISELMLKTAIELTQFLNM